MEQAGDKPEWQPTQYTVTQGPDMRNSKLGPRGYKAKRKREIEDALEQQQEEAADTMDADEPPVERAPTAKRQRVEGAPYREVRHRGPPLTPAALSGAPRSRRPPRADPTGRTRSPAAPC